MDWSNFIFWWLEWPLKITITGILLVALILFWNNVLLLVFRGTALIQTTTLEEDGSYRYVPTDGMPARSAWRGQFGREGRFHHLFRWYGWFWFRADK